MTFYIVDLNTNNFFLNAHHKKTPRVIKHFGRKCIDQAQTRQLATALTKNFMN